MRATDGIAYLVSQYPAVSHTFILREILGLRERGLNVLPISINDCDRPGDRLLAVERTEAERTFYVKKSGWRAAAASGMRHLAARPRRLAQAISLSLRLAGPNPRRLLYGLFYLAEALIVSDLLERRGVRRLHCHFANAAATVSMLACVLSGAEFSFSMHGPDEFFNVREFNLPEKIARAAFVRCIGAYARSQLMLHSRPEHWRKLIVCPLGVFPKDRPSEAAKTPGEPIEILCVGRLVPAKGQAVLLRAFAQLLESHPRTRLRLVGGGPDEAALKAEAARLGLGDAVVFEGALNQDKVRALYGRADVFALASFAEGIPVVLMEAMSAGIACVSTSIAGIPELIRDGKDGLLVPPSDEGALALALERLCGEPALRRELGRAARLRVEDRFNLDKNIDALARHLKSAVVAGLLVLELVGGLGLPAGAETIVTIGEETSSAALRGFGVNLGRHAAWGAEQLLSQSLSNPGLEPALRRRLARLTPEAGGSFFPIPHAAEGTAARLRAPSTDEAISLRVAGGGLHVPVSAPFRAGDFAVADLEAGDGLPPPWLDRSERGGRVESRRESRPSSPGRHCAVLSPGSGTARLAAYLDSLAGSDGRLLPLSGRWRLTFWARSVAPHGMVRAGVRRIGGAELLRSEASLTSSWKQFTFEIPPEPSGPPGPIELSFVSELGGDILIDDASLSPAAGTGPFRKEAVAALRSLRPRYLRDWQEQMGDSMENRLSPPWGRRPVSSGSGDARWTYSLPEFLDLCREVGAVPWIVVPTSFSANEWRALGAFLRSRLDRDGFEEALVEFGNENWNPLFAGASITDPAAHGAAAEIAFGALAEGSGADSRIIRVVNGQHASPDRAKAYSDSAPSADALAVAPYYLHSINASDSRLTAARRLFDADPGLLARELAAQHERGRALVIAEINSHADAGDAVDADRTAVVAGMASGSALAYHLLEARACGVARICAYVFSGFDAPSPVGRIRLWGLYRSLAGPALPRPTALALRLINEAATGRPLSAVSDDGEIAAYGFQSAGGASVVAVNKSAKPVSIRLRDLRGRRFSSVIRLDSRTFDSTNEEAPAVRLVREKTVIQNGDAVLTMPPFGLAALLTAAP